VWVADPAAATASLVARSPRRPWVGSRMMAQHALSAPGTGRCSANGGTSMPKSRRICWRTAAVRGSRASGWTYCTWRRNGRSRIDMANLLATGTVWRQVFQVNRQLVKPSSRVGRVSRRRYGQFCPRSKALEVTGQRCTSLVLRELVAGPKGYTALRAGLPGLATDLLAARLRELQQAGVIGRREVPAPTPATVYELTERGLALRPVIRELSRWGRPLLLDP